MSPLIFLSLLYPYFFSLFQKLNSHYETYIYIKRTNFFPCHPEGGTTEGSMTQDSSLALRMTTATGNIFSAIYIAKESKYLQHLQKQKTPSLDVKAPSSSLSFTVSVCTIQAVRLILHLL